MQNSKVWNYIHFILLGLLGLGASIMATIDYLMSVEHSILFGMDFTEPNDVLTLIIMYTLSILVLLYGILKIYYIKKK